MKHTIEDALEILGGTINRAVNIRIDSGELNLVRSLAKQVARGTALTDRQLELAVKKIEKYRVGLTQNLLNVDELLLTKPLRMPIREIDRTQSISLITTPEKKTKILVKFVFSKKFASVWSELQEKLTASVHEQRGEKILSFNELDLHRIVTALLPLNFELSEEVCELHDKIQEIVENPDNYTTYVDLINDEPVLVNVNSRCEKYLEEQGLDKKDSDFLVFLDRLKSCGIHNKKDKILAKIEEISPNSIVKNMLTLTETRFRLNPEDHGIDTIFNVIDTLKQWPVLVIVDDTKDAIHTTKTICEHLVTRIPRDEIVVFFRMQNGDSDQEQFNQYVKDNHLNNFIDSRTKVVFVTKNRIPKPLFSADWKPRTALVTSNYEYGKTSAYLNDFSTVYYYNNSVSVRHGRIKGMRQIVQL